MTETGRVYAGRSETQRRDERRERLLSSGLALFGTEGYATTTIERLCAHASVATRSFYEEYPSREALLRAVYERVVSGANEAVRRAVTGASQDLPGRISAGVAAYVRHLTDDPRRAQVAHREVRRVGVLEVDRQAAIMAFAGFIAREARLQAPDGDPQQGRVLALALAGAASEVLVAWVGAGEPRPPTGPVVEGLTRLYLAALTQTGASSPAAQG